MEGALWLNRRELARPKYAKLHNAFVGYDGIFEHFQIGANKIREIQNFSWQNSNQSCQKDQHMTEKRFHAVSKEYIYKFDKIDGSVHFQLKCCRKRIDKEMECSIFLKILTMPSGIESVVSEMDILCHCVGGVHRSLMQKQKLLSHGSTKGIIVFRSENVTEKSPISWKFAIRMEPKQVQSRIKDRFPVSTTVPQSRLFGANSEESVLYLEDRYSVRSGSVISEPENDDVLHDDEYVALMEHNDALKKKHQETLWEVEDIKMERDMAKEMCLKKVKEVKRLKEQLKQKDKMVQSKIREIGEVKERLKILKRENTAERDHERAHSIHSYIYMEQENKFLQDEVERMEIENRRIREELAVASADPPKCYVFNWFKKE